MSPSSNRIARHHPIALTALGLVLLAASCDWFGNPSTTEIAFHAPVKVTRAGLYEIGKLVNFQADKTNTSGSVVSGTRLDGSVFTDMLGQASCQFGYKIATVMGASDERECEQGARVIARVEDGGVTYTDTAFGLPVSVVSDYTFYDTLRINLP